MLALSRQGYEPLAVPTKMQDVFAAGHEAERQVWAKGIIKGLAQEYVELAITEKIMVTGHLDCWDPETPWGKVTRRYGSGRVYEVKSQSEAEWKPIRESPFWPRYAYQISVYMHSTGLPLTVIRVLRDRNGDISKDEREVFDVPPKTIEEIRRRVFEVEMLARRDLTEVECVAVEFPCPFYYTHVGDREVRELVDDEDAVVLAQAYTAAKYDQQAAAGRVKTSRDALTAWLGDRRRVELPGGWLVTKYTTKAGRVEYDRKESTSVRVTAPKEEESDDA